MAEIQLKHVYKKYEDKVVAVQDFNLKIKDQEFVIFVGPSGCGKSTTLRMIAGLEEISDGELLIDGKMMNQVQSCDRDIAMVFQNYALYPHMTVFENMAYSLRLKKVPKKERRQKVEEAAKILGLEGVLDRKPGELSGGQKQRVAMGRAIVRNPRIFLMDEPLSNLDAKLRTQMRAEILRLYQKLKTTFIYVTHDQTEAMTLGTKIVVMKRRSDSASRITGRNFTTVRQNTFVAGFIGMPSMNFFQGKCCRGGEYGTYLQIGDFAVNLTEEDAERVFRKGYMGEVITVGVRPEDLVLTEEGTEHEVLVYEMLGAETYLYFTYEGKDVALRTMQTHHIDGRQDSFVSEMITALV